MELYIMRHGEAGFASPDDIRQLTERGEKQSFQVALECAPKISKSLKQVVSSPLVRARQTAAIVADALPHSGLVLSENPVLVPESTPQAIAKFIAEHDDESLLLVGHQPVLGQLVHWLSGAEAHRFFVSTSSFFAIEMEFPERGCGSVLWEVHA